MSYLRLTKGSNNGGNEVGADVGMGSGASGLVGESMKGGGNGREWEVAAASALIRIMAALYPNKRIGLGGGADNTGEGGDSDSDGDGIGQCCKNRESLAGRSATL
ncbi:hypothetical protein Tco_0673127 [Tanacetum coccineum]